jgi:hypothetical protein
MADWDAAYLKRGVLGRLHVGARQAFLPQLNCIRRGIIRQCSQKTESQHCRKQSQREYDSPFPFFHI